MVIKVLQLYLTKKIIDSAIFMANSLSNLVHNLTEGAHIQIVKIEIVFMNMKVSSMI